jgi:hypothetical protein
VSLVEILKRRPILLSKKKIAECNKFLRSYIVVSVQPVQPNHPLTINVLHTLLCNMSCISLIAIENEAFLCCQNVLENRKPTGRCRA